MQEAVERRWITPFADGQYIYGAPWAHLVRLLQTELVRRAGILGFEEWLLPRYIPHEALDSFKLTQFAPDLLLRAGEDHYLDPVQCVSFYHHLRGRTFRAGELPVRVVEAMGGWTWRNETKAMLDGPYRAKEFLRVEHVFCGTPEQVRQVRKDLCESISRLFSEFGIAWQVVVGSGCMDLPSLTQARESAQQADDVPVQDIEVPIRGALSKLPDLPLPYTTTHTKLSHGKLVSCISDHAYWDHDEVCGCSVEGDHLTRDFSITDESGQPVWSGCCGVGLNRLVLALLYQHGFDSVVDVVEHTVGRSSNAVLR